MRHSDKANIHVIRDLEREKRDVAEKIYLFAEITAKFFFKLMKNKNPHI